ncbi:MAG TPA: NADH-quinone oxidoreductase subunit N [Bdellovibrionota bacterium]|nr:NADH-quinone oxidoreductase subunit N [Bdellovibrionota bacterium]
MESLMTIRPELLGLGLAEQTALMPYLAVTAGCVLAIIVSVIKFLNPKWTTFLVCLAACCAGVALSVEGLHGGSLNLFNDMMVIDGYAAFFHIVFLVSAAVTLLVSLRYLDHEGLQHPEYYVLVLFSALGMMLMASAKDLIVFFVALETMSLAVYSLVGFRRADRRSNEAAMKYFILGGAASAVLLYGVALIYGITGSTHISVILNAVVSQQASASPLFSVGLWLLVAGFLFKVASVPFHMWMPDVYEGAPVPVTGFMTTGLKAAAFAAFVRVFISMGYGKGLAQGVENHLHDILWVCAVLTMVAGNVIALTQTNLKRILAYSSIAHTGYIMVGLIAAPHAPDGYSSILLYLAAYAVMNLGAFVVLTLLAGRGDEGLNLHDLSGVARRNPVLAFGMAVFLFSMAGVPPTAGFVAKYLLLYSAVQAGEVPLVVIAVLCSAVSVYYYLRVLVYMYMREPVAGTVAARVPFWSMVAMAAMVLVTLQVGLLPAPLVEIARRAVQGL